MYSKNKPRMTSLEKSYVDQIKSMNCILCDAVGPSECHEIRQGHWFTSMPLCASCHRDNFLGLHGQKKLWRIKKWDELDALNETLRMLYERS